MKLTEKLTYLQENHFGEWLNVRRRCQEDVSQMYPMFCVCGKLATGLHESGCRKFQNKVTTEAVKKLSDLLPKKV